LQQDSETQRIVDTEHLRLLAFFHYVSGGVTLAFSLFFCVWLVMASVIFTFVPAAPHSSAHQFEGPPLAMFLIFGLFALLGLAYGVLEIVAGRLIARRRRRVLTLVVAIPRLLFLPYGMILSIFTLLVLERPSVKQLYSEARAP
jgi:hypothetical protein